MKIIFYLIDKYGTTTQAADCNELARLAEWMGYGKYVENLGSCWKWNDGEIRELRTIKQKTDILELGNGTRFERVTTWNKE